MVKFFIGMAVGLGIGVGVTLGVAVTLGRRAPERSAEEQKQADVDAEILKVLRRDYAEDNNDARMNSVASTLQTLRGQIELFKIQHADLPPAANALAKVLSGPTNAEDTSRTAANGTLGPYVQQFPTNPVNGQSAVGAGPAQNIGWVYQVSGGRYTIEAVNTMGDGVLTY